MIGIDTNVMVRYLVQDDPGQSSAAATAIDALTEDEPGFLSLVTVVELYWVLRKAYKISADRCADLIGMLLDAREIRIDRDSLVRVALGETREGLDFADALIAETGRSAGCDHTVTFDRRATTSAQMRLLPLAP